ncbi:MAG: YdiU family protein [Desulfobulbaceae bacterium]|nr:YdiU family protein [Desulfobulbaceae bacterium]
MQTNQGNLTLETLRFDNSFVRELPADNETVNRRRQVHHACYSRVRPLQVAKPQLLAFSPEAAALLNLPPEECRRNLFAQIFSGNALLPGMDPHAACYGGHQFGNWAGQLGDGRAINLGEVLNLSGERSTLQLKGAGPTPYSRNADGFAVLRSSLREFLCSEAMHHLGIPTTRALSLMLTGEPVERDMFYDGHPKEEPGAVICRIAPNFIRFGNFEIFAARNDLATLQQLTDYTIRTFFPQLGNPGKNSYIGLFREACHSTAKLMVQWLRVGFVHGVMNTDNMSILGLTIDYGPYGWLEGYDPAWTPNTTDAAGRRYCFGRQAQIAHWNLAKLANALYPLVEETAPFEEILQDYTRVFDQHWQEMMAAKLGLQRFDPASDQAMVEELFLLLMEVETDMTIFFRALGQVAEVLVQEQEAVEVCRQVLHPAWYQPEELNPAYQERLAAWLVRYQQRLRADSLEKGARQKHMNQVNPKYVFRNYLAQQAIDQAEAGEYQRIYELLDLLRRPYDEQPEREHFAAKRPEWARNRPGCSMLSCSS